MCEAHFRPLPTTWIKILGHIAVLEPNIFNFSAAAAASDFGAAETARIKILATPLGGEVKMSTVLHLYRGV